MRVNNKTKIIFLIIFLVLLVGTFFFLYNAINNENKTIKDLSFIVFDGRKQSDQIIDLRQNFEKFRPDIEKINSYLVAQGGEVGFIEMIENLARGENLSVEITSVSIEKSNELTQNGLEFLVLNIKTEGSWNGNLRFLSLLETSPYKISLEKSALVHLIDKSSVSGWQGVFNIKVLKKNK